MRSWIRVDLSLPRHPKAILLGQLLKKERAHSYLVDLWTFAATYYPSGELTDVDPRVIAEWCSWKGDPKQFMDALRKVKGLDVENGRVFIHDWTDQQGKLVEEADKAKKRAKAWRDAKRQQLERASHEQRTHETTENGERRTEYGVRKTEGEEEAPTPKSEPKSEARLQSSVVDLARRLGYMPKRQKKEKPAPAEVVDPLGARQAESSKAKPRDGAEVQAYLDELGEKRFNGTYFFDSYEACGWVVGSTKKPMKDWKGAVRMWIQLRNEREKQEAAERDTKPRNSADTFSTSNPDQVEFNSDDCLEFGEYEGHQPHELWWEYVESTTKTCRGGKAPRFKTWLSARKLQENGDD